jgi:hypothetical protein
MVKNALSKNNMGHFESTCLEPNCLASRKVDKANTGRSIQENDQHKAKQFKKPLSMV